jgi:chromosome segregation ATPase
MLLRVSTPPSEPIANELQALRTSIDALSERLGELAAENKHLRGQLEHSQAARTDLVTQSEHLIHQLAVAREEVRSLKGEAE